MKGNWEIISSKAKTHETPQTHLDQSSSCSLMKKILIEKLWSKNFLDILCVYELNIAEKDIGSEEEITLKLFVSRHQKKPCHSLVVCIFSTTVRWNLILPFRISFNRLIENLLLHFATHFAILKRHQQGKLLIVYTVVGNRWIEQ